MDEILLFRNKEYVLKEIVEYDNGGRSYFYVSNEEALILDENICACPNRKLFSYMLITDKQNQYMHEYKKLYRYLIEDIHLIEEQKESFSHLSREENLDASALEIKFETNFTNVYGMDSLKYLSKEYGITDNSGHTFFLDYFIKTTHGNIAVEENGVHYHHPQEIGIERYRKQLSKQNACADWGIKLYRFSSEDCIFDTRIEDDIKKYFGDSSTFVESGILVQRQFKLYEHQEVSLQDIKESRKAGLSTYLVVLPTASGKSKIIEQDLLEFGKEHNGFKALILAPNTNIVSDWEERLQSHLYKTNVSVYTFSYIIRHFEEYAPSQYDYIVIDEAHHAVAPVLKRVIQYFIPKFLIGITATDQRLDKKKLEDVFGSYRTSLSLIEAMEKGIVAKANVFRIETNLDLSKVRFNGKDYVNADLEKSIRVTSRNDLIGDVLKEYFDDSSMQGLIFCVNTAHAKEMEKVLNQRGISAKSYTRKEKNVEQIMSDFKNKKIRFLCA
ncbi:MAG: DEAD/DEAH box helicase family protein [Bacillota bacterium]|nr:DEAD/DEAH box helicase family protein [Bacillota bacterium]